MLTGPERVGPRAPARRKDEKVLLDDGSPGSFWDLTSDITCLTYVATVRCPPF